MEDRDVRVNAVVLRTETQSGAVESHTSTVGLQGSSDQLEGGALTCSVQTNQTIALSSRHRQTREGRQRYF